MPSMLQISATTIHHMSDIEHKDEASNHRHDQHSVGVVNWNERDFLHDVLRRMPNVPLSCGLAGATLAAGQGLRRSGPLCGQRPHRCRNHCMPGA